MSAPSIPVGEGKEVLVARKNAPSLTFVGGLDAVLSALASLKLTVSLLAYGIFVVLVGTLAQVQQDIWQVVPLYFRSWVMWVDVNLFFPPSFFPGRTALDAPLAPLPGGLAVGVALMVNLAAAHLWRFSISFRGRRTWIGLAVVALGVLLTSLVVLWGHNHDGFQSQAPLSWRQLWTVLKWSLGLSWIAGAVALARYGWALFWRPSGAVAGTQLAILSAAVFAFAFMSVANYYFVVAGIYPGDDALRVLWQLLQGALAGLVLLSGCVLVFERRAGIVLLHAGVALLMVNELFVSRFAAEYQLTLQEGETTNFMRDVRSTELAFIARADGAADEHIVIPSSRLAANAAANAARLQHGEAPLPIDDPAEALPVRVCVLQFLKNHALQPRTANDGNPATRGRGLQVTAAPRPVATGTGNREVDDAAVYVQLFAKASGENLGTFLLSQNMAERADPWRTAERVTAEGQEYSVLLRFKRGYLPYSISLVDVRKDDYLASDTPRNYSSDICLRDAARGTQENVHIKMNAPLRYAGLTFYQSSYQRVPAGGRFVETSTLAVVRNDGWMIPYVACAIVAVAMLAHFLTTLQRFLARRAREEQLAGQRFDRSTALICAAAALAAMAFIAPWCVLPGPTTSGFNLTRFGALPVAHRGRVKPLDTLARNALRELGQRETVRVSGVTISATQWLLDTVSSSHAAQNYPVLRIENEEVLRVFGLPRREGLRYSLADLRSGMNEFLREVMAAGSTQPELRTLKQKQLLELDRRLESYVTLQQAFGAPALPPLPTPEQLKQDPGAKQRWLAAAGIVMNDAAEQLHERQPPLALPKVSPTGAVTWQTVHDACWDAAVEQLQHPGTPAAETPLALFQTASEAYAAHRPAEFNAAVESLHAVFAEQAPDGYAPDKIWLESWFNHVSPFYLGEILYLLAFVAALLGWLLRSRWLNWSSFSVLVVTFVLHSAALVLRVYLSGRPPVTNLYSSAIFIGWGCVVFGLVLELIFRNGLGNVLCAVAGFSTLLIAMFLGAGGDTIEVLQAVLDTQFWLATHVVCISLGYTTTFVAGLLGVFYVLFGLTTPLVKQSTRRELARMIYGATCFAIFFSFLGTVLGGLWADDSWGRFWGWDPKENGALMIVLWNALVLHARWDKLVGDRGLALLVIGGNIITSWSWFGVNQLGVGLHSYGFTNGVVLSLGVFAGSQLILIGLGLLPKTWWWSYRADPGASPA